MFKVQDNKISLNKTKRLTNKQLNQLHRLSEHDQNRYMLSLMGLVKTRVPINRIKTLALNSLDFKVSGSIFNKMRSLQNTNEAFIHRPTERHLGQWIGVEIECFIPHQSGNECNTCNCDDDAGEHTDGCRIHNSEGHWSETEAHAWLKLKLADAGVTSCNVKYDGSLACDEGHGVEVTILFNTNYGFEPLERLCKALTRAGCYVNKTCGLHVHLDARHLTKLKAKRIGNSIGHSLPVIKWLVPESRHTNEFCKLGVSAISRRANRYFAVNLTSYPKYKTIEIRLHSGTISATKITHWINLLRVLAKANLKTDLVSFQDLLDVPGINDTLVEYVESRINELHTIAWSKLMPIAVPEPQCEVTRIGA